jgi:ribulose-phosphate 3-epimerase
VPNISIGIPVLEATRRGTTLPIDCHLMMVEPDAWVDEFAHTGADRITIHAEATPHLHRVVQAIDAAGKMPGVSINPATPIAALDEIIPYLGQVLIMTVNPGFGGQSFIAGMVDKIARVRERIERRNPACRLQVDGGINVQTIRTVVDAGADTVVAGSAVFTGALGPKGNLAALREALA